MTSRVVFICHAATSATRRAAFPFDEPVESTPPAADLPADTYLTAPETRCQQTAKALGLPAEIDTGLRDCDYGMWRGRTLDDLTPTDPTAVTRWLTDPTSAPHGGESTMELLTRVGAWLDALPQDGGTIAAVTHAAVIRAAVVHAILAPPQSFWRIDVPPLSRTVLSGRPRAWSLRAQDIAD